MFWLSLGALASSPPAVLLCPADDACDEAAAYTQTALPDAEVVRLELLLERDNGGWASGVDTRAALAGALERAGEAAEKGRWRTVRTETTAARDALAAVRGDVNNETLFALWFLDGAAAVALGVPGDSYSLRQAAALADEATKLPPHTEATARVWADERRKLVVGGTGTLALSGGDDVRWSIDGVALGPGVTSRELLPGNHRVVATRAGSVRSWQGEAPVLAGRTVRVEATFPESTSTRWLQARLEEAFDSASGPPELTSLLADWAARRDLTALRLVHVEAIDRSGAGAAATIGPADPLRPAAADGERQDHGDGIPSTYAEEVLARDEAARAGRPYVERRLRLVWFDATLQRFSLDAPVASRPELADTRFRAALHVGYAGMMAHHHAAFDLGAAWRVGPVEIEGRIGLVRADAPYNLYADWVDQQLYHVYLGVRWAPSWRVAPFVAAGPELYVPAAFGGRVGAGVQLRIERRWVLVAEGHGGWLDQGASYGGGIALGWMY
jgi:hypothetical protein